MNAKYKRLVSDTLLLTISSFSSKAISFFFIPLYTSILSAADYGAVDLIQTTVTFLYPLLTLSISEATVRYAVDKTKTNVLTTSLCIILTGIVPLLLVTPFISQVNELLYQHWGLFITYYCLFNIHYCFSQYTRGTGKMRLFAVQGIINTIVVIAANIILLVFLRVGIKGYLLSFILGYFITSLFMFVSGKYWKELQSSFDKQLAKEMLRYSLPMIPTQVFWWINSAADRWIIIGKVGFSANGLYSVAHKIPTLLTLLTGIFNQAWQVSAFGNYGNKDNDEFFSKVYSMFVFINLLVGTVIITFSNLLGSFLFSKEFYMAWTYVPVLLLASIFNGLSGMLASAFTAAKKTNGLFVSTGIGAIVNIVLNILFVDAWGTIGAAYATVISCICVFVVRLIHTNSYIKIQTEYFLQAMCFVVLCLQVFFTSNQIGNIWAIGVIALILILGLNTKNLVVFASIIRYTKNTLVEKSGKAR